MSADGMKWSSAGPLKVNLGAGARPRKGFINVDALALQGVDVVADGLDFLSQLPDSSVAFVLAEHFMEHVPDLATYLVQIARTLNDGGVLEIAVPHHSSPYFYSDPTHRTAFGLYSFSYFSEDNIHKRKVPHYFSPVLFNLVSARLVFKAPREFPMLNAAFRSFGVLMRTNSRVCEFYEAFLSRLVPCYEVRFRLERKQRDQS